MKNYFKMFCRRISKDLRQRELFSLKLLFFLHSSTILVLYPYLTIHMRELGINVEETAIMSAITPVIAILMPPLAGMLADKIGNFRVMLAAFSMLGGVTSLLLLLVPVGRIKIGFPDKSVLSMSCAPDGLVMLQHYEYLPCNAAESSSIVAADLKLESCGIGCHAFLLSEQSNAVFNSLTYGIISHDPVHNETVEYSFQLSLADINVSTVLSESPYHRRFGNNERYQNSVRKISNNAYYFPTPMLFNLSCVNDTNSSQHLDCVFGVRQHAQAEYLNVFQGEIKRQFVTIEDEEENRRLFTLQGVSGSNVSCRESYSSFSGQEEAPHKTHISITIPIMDEATGKVVKHLDLGHCAPRCLATTDRTNICTNKKQMQELDMKVTFWTYLSIRVFIGIVSGTSFSMFEGAVIAIIREHKADYGLQRIYATIGGMISSPLSGILVDVASRGKEYTDFRPIFFLYAILKVGSGFLMLFVNLEFKKGAHSVVKDVLNVLRNAELVALFIASLILGCAWGFIESFLFWLLQDLGASKSLMGLTISVAGVVGIPLLVLSGPIIKRMGHANVLFIGFVFYAIRLLGYSFIYNPWYCLFFEAMEAITFGLSFTAAVTYAAKLSTVTTDTTIQGMLGGLYFGVGKGVGSLTGGYLIKLLGIRDTFQLFAALTTSTGIFYLAIYHLVIKRISASKTHIVKDGTTAVASKCNHADCPVVYEDALANPAFEDTEDSDQIITTPKS